MNFHGLKFKFLIFVISTLNFSKENKVEQLRKKLKDLNSDPRIKRDSREFIIKIGWVPDYCGPDADCDAPNVR
jgi:hypothetical protein